MPDYSEGKIYTIRNRNDNTKIYVGSTIQPLHKRFYSHKCNSKKENCMNIKLYLAVNNDWANWYIELYENYPCNNKNELFKREGEIIRQIGTLNSIIAGRDKKQYYVDNLDTIKEQQQKYHIDNAEKCREYKKEYYDNNAEYINKKSNHYYYNNIDRIKEHQQKYRIEHADKNKEYQKQYYLKKKNEKLKL